MVSATIAISKREPILPGSAEQKGAISTRMIKPQTLNLFQSQPIKSMKYLKSVIVSATAILAVIAGPTAKADYSNTLMSLSPQPVAYWLLQETVAPPTCYATNLGTLGAAANGRSEEHTSEL